VLEGFGDQHGAGFVLVLGIILPAPDGKHSFGPQRTYVGPGWLQFQRKRLAQ
jgi:hypothetical protein